MCRCVFTFTQYSRICRLCGVETPWLCLDQYNIYSAPLERGYNRRHRFRVKVQKLVGLHSGPASQDPVWAYLDQRRFFLHTPSDIRDLLRTSPLKQKHYDNLRTFCDAFTHFRVEHCQYQVKEYLLHQFDSMYAGWNSLREQTFFSYAWLLRHFLTQAKSPLVAYLKPKTCRRRHMKYVKKLELITQSRGNGETRCYVTLKTHFRCEKSDVTNPPPL